MKHSGSSFTGCWKIGTAMFRTVLSWCANIFVSSSKILLHLGSRPTHSRKQLTYSSSLVSSSSVLRISLPGVAGLSGFGVLYCSGSVGFSGVIPASFQFPAGRIVPTSFSVGAGRIVPESVLLSIGGIVPASFMGGTVHGPRWWDCIGVFLHRS